MTYDELPAFAKKLRSEGFDAKHDLVTPQSRNGITVCPADGTGIFVSLMELNDPTNAQLLAARDFEGIRAKRSAQT